LGSVLILIAAVIVVVVVVVFGIDFLGTSLFGVTLGRSCGMFIFRCALRSDALIGLVVCSATLELISTAFSLSTSIMVPSFSLLLRLLLDDSFPSNVGRAFSLWTFWCLDNKTFSSNMMLCIVSYFSRMLKD